ncbi:MAG TPA: hypothetical protein VHR16_06850 [Candidatus Limnocylindrales bacterium]|nr:hypothetical protein [Candidatus Limnocylindrales bacterium]
MTRLPGDDARRDVRRGARAWRRRGPIVLAAGVLLAMLLGFTSAAEGVGDVASRIGFIGVGVAAVAWLLHQAGALTSTGPESFEAALSRPPLERHELPGIRAIDAAVRMSLANAFGVEAMLKPHIRALATWRLLQHRGIDVTAEPTRARQALGEVLWRLTDSSGVRPPNNAPGLALPDLQGALDQLEQL